MPDLGNEEIYRAARDVIQAGLARDDSAFTPGRPVWTAVAADDLYRRFVENPLLGPERFIDKFRQQLSQAPQATVQLAAELLYLHLLAPVDIGPATKRATLAQIWPCARSLRPFRWPWTLPWMVGSPGLERLITPIVIANCLG